LKNHSLLRTRVKICGITRLEDAECAANLGVDALGFVFYSKSPRSVSVEQARTIIQKIPAFVTTVGLFVNAEFDSVNRILAKIPLNVLQFHGEETPDYCESFNMPYIKAVRMQEDIVIQAEFQRYHSASALLVDTYVKGIQGGTGISFDWQRIPLQLSNRLILAGGLTINNVAQAIALLHPYAVDVSGGVEHSKGLKDKEKITQFMKEVLYASCGKI
jgi:phosphoribosylanthranilate isomerase